MANRDSGNGRPQAVGQAMNRVLQAERDAEQAIGDCERKAREMRRDAQQRAQRIAERTDKRITSLHMRCAQAARTQIKALERAENPAAREQTANRLEPADLAAVVEQVAVELSGGGPSTGGERER